MATKAFDDFFSERGIASTNRLIEGDELLVLRGGTTFKVRAVQYSAFFGWEDETTVTTITGSGVWTPIEGTATEIAPGDSFSFASNQLTYNGPNQVFNSLLGATVSAKKMGGGFVEMQLGLFVNGSKVGLHTSTGVGDTEIGSCSTASPYALQNGDVIEARVLNATDGDDFTVMDFQFIID